MHVKLLALLVLFAGALHLAAAVATDANKIISIFVGLKQQNMDKLHEIALSVSDPDSPLYGQYLSKEEVLKLVAPPKEDHDLVVNYFRNLGFSVQSFGDSLILQAPVKTIERALQTRMDTLIATKHSSGNSLHRTFPATPYKVAEHVMDKIEIITTNTGESNIKRLADYYPKSKRAAEQVQSLPNIVPMSIRLGYNISGPHATATNPKTTQLVVEFNHETIPQDSDIQQFVQDTKEQYANWTQIYGGYGPVGVGDVRESSLDFEYIMTVGRGAQNWWLYIKGWMMEFAVALNAMQTTPLVASISWGWAESDQCNIMETGTDCKGYDTYDYITRVNNEFAKLAARGVTLLAGAGDTGAAGPLNPNCEASIPPLYPMFPASSPWVTSVGAVTWIGNKPNTPPSDEFDALFSTKKRQITPPPLCNVFPQTQCAFSPQIEVVSSAQNTYLQFTSGGGFSNKTPQPSYQTAAVSSYLKIPSVDVMMPPPGSFNPKNRAYPDISAVGARFLTIILEFPAYEEGTSASTPVIGAMVSLMNDARLNKNKAPLGFLNPLLYKLFNSNPKVFNDITVGDNRCAIQVCCPSGYGAAPGWDAASGLGTPNFPEMMKAVLNLK